ncbi:MAG: hypothetical protein ACLP1X_27110 [Polyangiaceae bacterium]
MKRRGDYVKYWFDTGAMGYTILYGVVEQAGPKTYTVRWESGIRNRVRQDNPSVKVVSPEDVDEVSLKRLSEERENPLGPRLMLTQQQEYLTKTQRRNAAKRELYFARSEGHAEMIADQFGIDRDDAVRYWQKMQRHHAQAQRNPVGVSTKDLLIFGGLTTLVGGFFLYLYVGEQLDQGPLPLGPQGIATANAAAQENAQNATQFQAAQQAFNAGTLGS